MNCGAASCQRVMPLLAPHVRVAAYDRAGMGWSEMGPDPRDARQITSELHTLLSKAGIEGPYVLVGHSFGGMFSLYALFTRPTMFQHVVAISPSLWWRDRFLLEHERAFSQQAQEGKLDLVHKSLTMWVGDREMPQAIHDTRALQLRLHPAASRVAKLAQATPSSFVAFDLLAVDGQDLVAGQDAGRDRRRGGLVGAGGRVPHLGDGDDALRHRRDDGTGLGASHQCGWTALVAHLICTSPEDLRKEID